MSNLRQVVQFDPDDPTRLADFDTLFKIPVVIDVAHHEIHEGCAYKVSVFDSVMGIADQLIIAFKTPAADKRVHLLMEFITLTGGLLSLVEGPTWDNTSGTLRTIFNRKRDLTGSGLETDKGGAFSATNQILENPTTFAGGATIDTIIAHGQKNQFAGSGRDVNEWVLDPATQYGVVFTSVAASNQAQIWADWYEHEDE